MRLLLLLIIFNMELGLDGSVGCPCYSAEMGLALTDND